MPAPEETRASAQADLDIGALYARLQREVSIERLAAILAPFAPCVLPDVSARPYFMVSLDLDAALGLGATLVALLLRRDAGPADGHPAPDLAEDAPAPDAETRAPEHFRPDPTAVPTAEEREALRPATGPAPTLAADRGSIPGETQGAA